MFPDNIFKYASSVQRHFPGMFEGLKTDVRTEEPKDDLLFELLENLRNPYDTVEVDEAERLLAGPAKPFVIDVRRQEQYRRAHLPTAVNIPLEEMRARSHELPADRETPLITVCNRGNMSLTGALFFKSLGYRNVRSLNGGVAAWMEKGLATG
jgi:rhodanese-related sulfurtransferase